MSDEDTSAYLNGRFVPLGEACLSPLDRGFLFGDGVYEVIPVYGGRPFRLSAHLTRLARSLAEVRIDEPASDAQWTELIDELVARNGGGDQAVYLQVTRGVDTQRDHAFDAVTEPTVFAMSHPLEPPARESLQQGVAAVVVDDLRWQRCDIKSTTLLANVLARQQAIDSGAQEALLVRYGEVTEGAASNVFMIRGGTLLTPPKGPRLLPGITRDLVLELAAADGIPCEECAILEHELAEAEELWLTSSTKEIRPVTALDGRPVGDGRPGPLFARLHRLLQEYKEKVRAGGAD